IERFPHREMEFVAMNGISYLSLDNELLELLYRAGFSQLNLALVSSDKTVRETTKRPHTLESYVKVVSKAHQLGFKIVSYQILGLPNESLDSMIQTLAFNARLPVLLGASPFYQTPNAPIARGLEITEADYLKARLTALAIETENFSRDDIYTLFATTRIINFLKGLSIEHDTALDELMNRSWPDSRATVGFELLRQLQLTGRWHAWTKTGSIENAHVRSSLLRRVLSQIDEVATQEGPKISVRDFARGLSESYQPGASGTVTRKVAPVVLGSSEILPL
ncbi:MAG TPA: radical SAM protein, partial [Candidatus Binatia bacterium]|nr:radical SAM protein [Candidatus Binatia bacterium]